MVLSGFVDNITEYHQHNMGNVSHITFLMEAYNKLNENIYLLIFIILVDEFNNGLFMQSGVWL